MSASAAARPLAFLDVDGVLNHFVSADLAERRGLRRITVVPQSLPVEFTVSWTRPIATGCCAWRATSRWPGAPPGKRTRPG